MQSYEPGLVAEILIASLGEEMASHESLKSGELQHSGSSKIKDWEDLMKTDIISGS